MDKTKKAPIEKKRDQTMVDVTRDAVLSEIDAARTYLREREASTALVRAQIATAYATLMVAENQPLGVLGDIVSELRRLNADGLRTWPQQ